MRRAAIVTPLRTPIGAFGGTLRPLAADALVTAVFQAVMARSRIDPAAIEDLTAISPLKDALEWALKTRPPSVPKEGASKAGRKRR